MSTVVDPSLPLTISLRARVLAEEVVFPGYTNHFGFALGASTGTQDFSFGLGTSSIQDANGAFLSTTIDTTQFHDYRLETTPGVGYKFFVDGVLLGTGLPRTFAPGPNEVGLGDFTGGANTSAVVTAFTFVQQPQFNSTTTAVNVSNTNPTYGDKISGTINVKSSSGGAVTGSATVFLDLTPVTIVP
jgi:hypothetical protein